LVKKSYSLTLSAAIGAAVENGIWGLRCSGTENRVNWLIVGLAIPGVVDLSDIAAEAKDVAKIALESVQELLLKLALQMARDDYEDRRERQRHGVELAKQAGKYAGRQTDTKKHDQIIALRAGGNSIAKTAKLAGCSESQVKRIWFMRIEAIQLL
jgi:hypothetical protein